MIEQWGREVGHSSCHSMLNERENEKERRARVAILKRIARYVCSGYKRMRHAARKCTPSSSLAWLARLRKASHIAQNVTGMQGPGGREGEKMLYRPRSSCKGPLKKKRKKKEEGKGETRDFFVRQSESRSSYTENTRPCVLMHMNCIQHRRIQ